MKTAKQAVSDAMNGVCKSQGGAVPEGSSIDPARHDEIDKHDGSGHGSAPSPGVGGSIPVSEGSVGTGKSGGNGGY